ncbi:Gaa1-like protein [Cokeromyces recurvatus]|uniref:Gaa1-like protein n=1 Tax=Cokeromyces recurvatus TaxID=90255 RepID=UPI002220D14F|nr:Gaa1-like protein [Cokeromyces recurvatus]KAI7901964.1 Gaa1-like protein [Cokeromyces recurvatus]
MLLSALRERWSKKRASKNTWDLKKQVKLFNLLQKSIPILSLLLFIIGIGWILMLPYEGYNKQTYISENALLPGQVNLEYGYNDFRTAEDYRQKILEIQTKDSETRAKFIHEEFRRTGFVSAVQHFVIDGKEPKMGVNAFAINKAPRSDGKEALILSASWKSRTGEYNTNGIASLLSLAKLFKRNVYWSKDVILLVTDEGQSGTQAWLDAYHGITENDEFSSVIMPRSGAVQGVLNLDFPGIQDYQSLGILFEGVNGQLPNLDLINTVVLIATRTIPSIHVTLHDNSRNLFEGFSHYRNYLDSLNHLLQSMKYLVFGHPSSDAGLYLRYKIDAITIHGIIGSDNLNQIFGFNRIGRLVESTFRSLNNLLEHFHQSFFFYLLPQPNRYVSISQYMPPIILFACALIFQSLSLYYLGTKKNIYRPEEMKKENNLIPPAYSLKKRHTVFGFTVLIITHITGIIIFYIMQPSFGWKYLYQFDEYKTLQIQYMTSVFIAFMTITLSLLWIKNTKSTEHDGTILKSFCLAQSALVITTVSLLNFTLGVATAILILVPYSLIQPCHDKHPILKWIQASILILLSPVCLTFLFCHISKLSLVDTLKILLTDYQIVHSWFLTYICTVYWPINMAMMIVVFTKTIS